ncbi:DUF3857 domain-containing protein [Granulicella arctica]|uniref:DUF3857 domain-containing protein n=1 Tax=Granulicella arctica TaxID=940613 RepID=A0A7Y9TK46_9BACT|nr:DUF3857 domain-containing protein [Granulicella arctica]NYF78912.1 hypothetical protein [Granulicella arctica]
MKRLFRFCLPVSLYLLIALSGVHAQKWTQPTPEELSMTEQKGAPEGDAVYLYHEEVTDDNEATFSYYNRIKILKDKGLKLAEIKLYSTERTDGMGTSVRSFSARTIHADGTVIPMTQPATDEIVAQAKDWKRIRKIYKLPQPTVGSILEYRYTFELHNHLESPIWDVQRDLYTRKTHYVWAVANRKITSKVKGELGRTVDQISWSPLLPSGVDVKRTDRWDGQLRTAFVLDAADIPAIPIEENMPPPSSFAYKVRFYYSAESSKEAFWKEFGAHWSEAQNHFIGPGPGVKAAVSKLLAPGDTPEQKLKKLYAAAMELDNTSVARDQGAPEPQVAGDVQPKSTDDVLAARRGNNDQINSLFIAMARAAGIKAYAMRVSNRDEYIFTPTHLTLAQLDDDITIVNLDGKEIFLDPGTRFCPFGHLGWRHSLASGLRQTEAKTEIASTPSEPFAAHQIQRVANLNMDEHGQVTGTVKLTFIGTAAIHWRQDEAVKGEQAVRDSVKELLKKQLPEGMNAEVTSIAKANEYEEPLTIMADVKGMIGTSEEARISLKADIFQAQSEQIFKPETREQPIYFDVSEVVLDAIRINLPPSITVASLPTREAEKLQNGASYDLSTESNATSVTIRRNYVLGRIFYPVSDYPEVRSFYSKMSAKDQESIVLLSSAVGAGSK